MGYNGKIDPKVESGERTEEESFIEFAKSFGDRSGDEKIGRGVCL